jgi:hypothetical protein
LQLRIANAASVQAYGDTFAIGALVVTLAIPVAFFLKRPVKVRVGVLGEAG